MRMDADPHDRRPSWLLSTVPAGHEAVSVKLTTLWITAVSAAGRRTPDALNCGIETTSPETGALTEAPTGALTRRGRCWRGQRRGREHVQLPASEGAAQLFAPARLKDTGHLYYAALCLLS